MVVGLLSDGLRAALGRHEKTLNLEFGFYSIFFFLLISLLWISRRWFFGASENKTRLMWLHLALIKERFFHARKWVRAKLLRKELLKLPFFIINMTNSELVGFNWWEEHARSIFFSYFMDVPSLTLVWMKKCLFYFRFSGEFFDFCCKKSWK